MAPKKTGSPKREAINRAQQIWLAAQTKKMDGLKSHATTRRNSNLGRDKASLASPTFTKKLFLRTGGFLYSRIPRAQTTNKYLCLSTLPFRHKLRDVCVVLKMPAGIMNIDASKFFSLLPSKTRGSSEKIPHGKPRTNFKLNHFFFFLQSVVLLSYI